MLIVRVLGRDFGWLWAAYAISALGTWLALDAFPLVAILALGAGPARVSLLASVGLAAGALVAVPLGPWVEFRRKRPVMIAMDLVRFAALASVPIAYGCGVLTFPQLVVASVTVAAAGIAFTAAAGACLKAVVRPEELGVANGRLESTLWIATVAGPPLGGAAIGLLGPVATMVIDAVSYLLSAGAVRAMRGAEPRPAARPKRLTRAALLSGWHHLVRHDELRPLFLNTVAVSGLIMACAPLLAVRLLGELGFSTVEYGLAFGLPCLGGLLGSLLSARLAGRFGPDRIFSMVAVLRAVPPIGLALVVPGRGGLLTVIVVELLLITCMGVFNPLMATRRLRLTDPETTSRVLAAWRITGDLAKAALTALWGLLAAVTSARVAIAAAGFLLLLTPLLLPRAKLRG
jgi:MFS family permease